MLIARGPPKYRRGRYREFPLLFARAIVLRPPCQGVKAVSSISSARLWRSRARLPPATRLERGRTRKLSIRFRNSEIADISEPYQQRFLVVPEAAVCDHMKPGLRGRYCAQFPKSCVDTSTIGNVMRTPWSTAMLRATSLVPGRNADTCDEPLFAAKCSAVLNAGPRTFGSATASGPT
jgi:hypothetical protein